MTGARINMAVIKEIQRLKKLGHTRSKVAELIQKNRETIRKYWNVNDEKQLSTAPEWALRIDWEEFNKELKRASKKVLYRELKDTAQLPSYQAFCEYLRKHSPTTAPEISLRIQRPPGASIEVDYSGDGIQILNPVTGEIYTAQLFVGSLSYSGYFYGEFTLTQKLEDFILAHNNMFSFFGGVASFIIPDNCKTAILENKRSDFVVHPTYQDMCIIIELLLILQIHDVRNISQMLKMQSELFRKNFFH
jgi:transposase